MLIRIRKQKRKITTALQKKYIFNIFLKKEIEHFDCLI